MLYAITHKRYLRVVRVIESGCQSLEEKGKTELLGNGFQFYTQKNFWRWMGWWLHNSMNVLNATNCISLQFSHSVMSNSLRAHGLQYARPPYPSPAPVSCSNSCALSRWCHPTISSSVVPFSSCFQSFSASGSFPMSQFFTQGGQSTGVIVCIKNCI